MTLLVIGLLLFLGLHSVRIVAEPWRQARLAAWGEGRWKGLYSLGSGLGLVLIVWGYGLARQQPVVLWTPPAGLRHPVALLVWGAFVLLAAAYVPGNAIKARLGHPMVLSVKVWALAHLLVNGTLADVLLFGSFLLWAVADFRVARRREPPRRTGARVGPTVATVVAGSLAWAGFAFWLHGWLIGVRPLP